MNVLMRTDPFRGFDRLTEQLFGTVSRPASMPLDAWREDDSFVAEFDLPGIDPDSVDIDIERNVLSVRAERPAREGLGELVASERSRGVFRRQLILGDNLDPERVEATYTDGVLRITLPVAEKAKPKKISVVRGDSDKELSA